jgi:hypothetical protein
MLTEQIHEIPIFKYVFQNFVCLAVMLICSSDESANAQKHIHSNSNKIQMLLSADMILNCGKTLPIAPGVH